MSVHPNTVAALAETIEALKTDPAHPVPTNVLVALTPLARPGRRLTIDLEASKMIGAPLVTLQEDRTLANLSALSPRQAEVARLVLKGLSNRSIADELCISIATVKDHVHAILRQLDLPSRSALIAASLAPLQD